jgi:hypothetical protein
MKRKVGLLGCVTMTGATVLLLHCSSSSPNPPPAQDFVPDSGLNNAETSTSGGDPTGIVTITPADISFGDNGLVDCGTQAASAQITVKNDTTKAVTINASLTAGNDAYTLSPATLGIQAGSTGTLSVIPKAIPAKSAITPELYSGNVEVRADPSGGGGTTGGAGTLGIQNIKLHQTARGAILVTTAQATQDFGGAKIGTSPKQTFSVTNNGNVPITLDFAVGSASFAVTPKATVDVAGTKVQEITFSPAQVQAYTDTLTAQIEGKTPLCGDPLANVQLKGAGSASIDIQPGNLAYGIVQCGQTAAAQEIVINNTGPAATYTPTFGKGGATGYALKDKTTGLDVPIGVASTLPGAGASTTLKVVPLQVKAPVKTDPNGLGDTLTITTTSPQDSPHNIQLTETAQGAFISLDQPSYTTHGGSAGIAFPTNILVSNTGNLPGTYTIAVVPRSTPNPPNPAPTGTWMLNSGGGSLAVGAPATTIVMTTTPPTNPKWGDLDAGGAQQYLADIVLTPSAAALCSDNQPTAPLFMDFN